MRRNFGKLILLAALLSPASAQTGVEVEFSNGNVYLKPDSAAVVQGVTEKPTVELLAQEILRLTNEARRENGLPELTRNKALEEAAGEHSQEMRTLNYFSHTSPTAGRETARKRVQKFGVNPQMVAENIFECSGYDLNLVARFAVQSFLSSPSHRKNLMDGAVTHIGIGVCESQGSVSVTQVFGGGV